MQFLPTAQAVSVFMVVLFLAYLTTILVPYAVRKPDPPGDASGYDWHFFVPCRDEQAVIGRTLIRLWETFPAGHIWVIDDDSEDGTDEVIADVMRSHDRIHCVQRRLPDARTGKGSALNSAYAALDASLPPDADRHRVIVCIVDADAELDPNALCQVTGPGGFGDPKVGAVQIAVFMSNRGERRTRADRGRLGNLFARYLVRMQDLEFRTTIAAMQMLRVRTGSVGMGGNGQFTRLSVLDDIGAQHGLPWHDALLEDYELGLRALLSGHQNRYVHDTHVAQEGLISMRRLLNQRTRWSQGNMQCSRYIPQILRSAHLSNSGVIEACYFLTLPFIQLAGVVVWPAVFVAITEKMSAATEQGLATLLGFWWFFALVFILGIAPFAVWGPIYRKKCEPGAPWWKGPVWGIGLWIYVYYMYLAAIRAAARLLLGRTGWVKTQRNAEPISGYRSRKAMSDGGSS